MSASRAGTARAVSQTTLLAKNIQRLLTLNGELGEIDEAAIYVKANIIQWVGSTAELPKEYQMADVVLDLSSRVVIPGMVNTHHHMCVKQPSRTCVCFHLSGPSVPHTRAVSSYRSLVYTMLCIVDAGSNASHDVSPR
jgi:imidazolonepropionase-like amidohydrolase